MGDVADRAKVTGPVSLMYVGHIQIGPSFDFASDGCSQSAKDAAAAEVQTRNNASHRNDAVIGINPIVKARKLESFLWVFCHFIFICLKIQEADQERILLLPKAGFPVNRIVKVLELEKGVQPGQLPFIEKDVRNFVRTCMKTFQENDALLIENRENDTLELLRPARLW
ncbi:hypothetical protein GH714_030577 [Hevea brasiliensis]|uniref:FAR1-related sequence 11-like HTH-like domain-containing protein n=1 Tax=Hevea brasiliensis TaxID=3981 RepID=A0A6A6K7T5_HEVBR|nr:hypothetical protein GH714_030577 [Hevea brasiliensis]